MYCSFRLPPSLGFIDLLRQFPVNKQANPTEHSSAILENLNSWVYKDVSGTDVAV